MSVISAGTGSGGAGSLLGEVGIGSLGDFIGLNLKGQPPQHDRSGSTLLHKTYAFEILPTKTTGGVSISDGSFIYYFGMNPTQIQFVDFSAGVSTYTAGGVTVEGGASLLRQYTISGRSGSAVRRGYSAGEAPSVGGASKPVRITTDGHRMFRELHKFFDNYAKVKSDPLTSHAYALAFHDFINDDHFIINPKQFNVDRTGAGDYRYSIQFDAVADRIGFQLGLLASIAPMTQLVTDVISTTINNVAGIVDDIQNTLVEFGELYESSMNQITNSVNRLGATARSAKETNLGFNQLKESFTESGALGNLTSAFKDAFNFEDKEADKSSSRDSARNGATQTTQLALAIEARRVEDNGFRAGADDNELDVIRSRLLEAQGVIPPLAVSEDFNPMRSMAFINARRSVLLLENALYARLVEEESTEERVQRTSRPSRQDETRRIMSQSNSDYIDYSQFPVSVMPILRGDTVRSICMRHVGSIDAMEYIIKINDLKFPFISESGEPFTLRYGDQIRVPALRGSTSNTKARASDSVDRALFGEDFRLTSDGDLTLANGLDDFSLISGIPNLKQALEVIKFRTKLGSNPIFPQIGIPDIIGDTSAADNVLSVYLGTKLCAETDPRIASVSASALWDQGDTISVMLECRAINNNESFQIGVIR